MLADKWGEDRMHSYIVKNSFVSYPLYSPSFLLLVVVHCWSLLGPLGASRSHSLPDTLCYIPVSQPYYI